MDNPLTAGSSTRRTSRQAEAGAATRAETRRKIVVAAIDVFTEMGYSPATVAKIADRADVSVQTLYSAWGNKRGLLRGVMSALVLGDLDGDLHRGSVPSAMIDGVDLAGMGSAEAIAFLTHQFRLLGERAAVGWRTYAQASAVDPEAAADWHELMAVRRSNIGMLMERMRLDLRPGLDVEAAADTAWALASPQVWDLMVLHGGYSVDDLEQWLTRTLVSTLLDGPTG